MCLFVFLCVCLFADLCACACFWSVIARLFAPKCSNVCVPGCLRGCWSACLVGVLVGLRALRVVACACRRLFVYPRVGGLCFVRMFIVFGCGRVSARLRSMVRVSAVSPRLLVYACVQMRQCVHVCACARAGSYVCVWLCVCAAVNVDGWFCVRLRG